MKILSKFTPAETEVILSGKNASLKELLKLTFMDLLLRQVLQTIEEPDPNEPDKKNMYVLADKNLMTARILPHESVFTDTFKNSPDLQIALKNLIKIILRKVYRSKENYIASFILKSPTLQPYFSANVFQKMFNDFSVKPEGKSLKIDIRSVLSQLDQKLPDLIKNQPQQALDIMKTIGGNIYLVKNLDYQLLTQVDKQFLDTLNDEEKLYAQTGDSSSFFVFSDGGSDHPHHSPGDHFDSSFDDASSDSSSGDSGGDGDGGSDGGGDSGCSGCGGGCGGGGD